MSNLSVDDINELVSVNKLLIERNKKLVQTLKEIREAAKINIAAGCLISGGWLEQMIDEVLND